MTDRPQHISFERLADLVEGRLPASEQQDAQAHITACARCAGQIAELRRVTGLMRADDSVDAPRDVLIKTIGMFRGQPQAPSLLRRLLATLNFDSGSHALAFGVRSGQAAPARQLLFSAGDVNVDLRLARGGEGWTISGQVLGPCDNGGRVELILAGASEATTVAQLNDLCEFVVLPPVAAGVYTLRLWLGEVEIEIPELDLRA